MVTFLVFILVLFSSALLIGVPVILASENQWDDIKGNVFGLGAAWSALVLLTGAAASY